MLEKTSSFQVNRFFFAPKKINSQISQVNFKNHRHVKETQNKQNVLKKKQRTDKFKFQYRSLELITIRKKNVVNF